MATTEAAEGTGYDAMVKHQQTVAATFRRIPTLMASVVYTYLDAWQKRLARGRSTAPREYPAPGTGGPRPAEAAG